jgi:hypothetical protein
LRAHSDARPAGRDRRVCSESDGEVAADLLVSPLFHCSADVDDVVGNDAEANPTFHPGIAFVAATVKPMPPLSHTDAALASGPPFLAVAKPALLLLAPAFNALGRAVGDANAHSAFAFAAASFFAE